MNYWDSDSEYYDPEVLGQVERVLGRAGTRGQMTVVKVIFLGPLAHEPQVVIRHVHGPVKKGDWLKMRESECEERMTRCNEKQRKKQQKRKNKK